MVSKSCQDRLRDQPGSRGAAAFPCKVPYNFRATAVSPGTSVQPTAPASDPLTATSGLLHLLLLGEGEEPRGAGAVTQNRLCHNTRFPNISMLQMPGSGGPAAAGAGQRLSLSPGSPAGPKAPRSQPGPHSPAARSPRRGEAAADPAAPPPPAPRRKPRCPAPRLTPRAGAAGSDGVLKPVPDSVLLCLPELRVSLQHPKNRPGFLLV